MANYGMFYCKIEGYEYRIWNLRSWPIMCFYCKNGALRISDLKFTVANYECRRTECAIAFECIDIRIARSCCGLVELLIISYKSLLCCGCLFLVICCNWIWYRFGRDSFSTACDIIYKKVNDVHSWPLFKFAAFDTPR